VTDDLGAGATWIISFEVDGKPQPDFASYGWLVPPPTVRIAGSTGPRGARITRFSVTAPAGSAVHVRCAGKRCPIKTRTAVVAPSGAPVRVRSLEKFLPAGIVVAVRVSKGDLIGKYTRFRIRRRKAPARWEACLIPGNDKPVECPL
jgi:hypothetical protein